MISDPKSTLIFKIEKKKISSFFKIQNDNISISKYSTTIFWHVGLKTKETPNEEEK
jgi:hypothetical protein